MSYFKRIDLDKLYPPFRKKIEELQANCLKLKSEYYATSGLRDWNEQAELYALGRTKKNVDATPAKPMGGIVTNALPGYSYHNFSVAIDFALDKDLTRAGLQPDWSPAAYTLLGSETAKISNLEWGGNWKFKDYPHVQLNIAANGIKLADLRAAYIKGGMPEVWKLLDTKKW